MVRAFALGSFVIAAVVVTAAASADDKVQEIRQQIANLQQQLDNLERQPPPGSRNVTQIGATRGRSRTSTGLIVRIYELNDIFAVAPPYGAHVTSDLKPGGLPVFNTTDGFASGIGSGGLGGGFGGGGFGGGGGQFNLRTSTAATAALAAAAPGQAGTANAVKSSQDDLIRVIKETISPDLWQESGKITRLGNAFIISADEETHEQIDALLNLFRERWGTLRTISVRAWWVPLSPAELKGLLDVPTEKAAPDGPPIFGLVSDDAWQKILQAWEKPAGENAQRRHAYQATLTAYNGQTVSSLSGTQSLAVGNVQPVVSESDTGEKKGQMGYQPEVHVVQEGLAFQMTPISNMSGRTVLLDVHSRLSLPSGDAKREPADRGDAATVLPTDATRAVDRRKVLIHRLSTTTRVPADRPYLVGGMSLASTETEGQQLYLFVKVTVQELRNDKEGAGKAVEPGEKPEEKAEPEKKAEAAGAEK